MNFLQRKTSWTNTELGILKVCVGSMGAAVGAYFHNILEGFLPVLIAVYLLTGIYLFSRWYKQLAKQ